MDKAYLVMIRRKMYMRVKEFMELYSDSNFHFMTSKGYLFLNSDQVKLSLAVEKIGEKIL